MFRRKCRIAGLGSLFLFGCEAGAGKHAYPDAPLMLDKKPVESKVDHAIPPLLIVAEPMPPTIPAQALASETPPSLNHLTGVEKHGPQAPAAQPARGAAREDVPAAPASRSRNLPGEDPGVPIRRQVPETYGHASDYSWLQGVLAKPAEGPVTLRYHEVPNQDTWGGLVALDHDSRLAPFQDGDLVLVIGELLAGPQNSAPHFRIRAVWLAHRNR